MRTVVNHRAATLKVFDPTFFQKVGRFPQKANFFACIKIRKGEQTVQWTVCSWKTLLRGFRWICIANPQNATNEALHSHLSKKKNAGLFIVSISILNCHTIHQKSFLERNKFSSSSFTHGAYWSHTQPSYHTPEPSGTYPRSTYMRCAAP